MHAITLDLPNPEATCELGAALARSLPTQTDSPCVVHLRGDLGAGKTALARAFLRSRGVGSTIRSPTYTLVETYPEADATYVHVDLYRLAGAGDLEGLGLRDLLAPGHVFLIEWPEHGGGAVPPADLLLALEDLGAGRRARITSGSDRGELWITLLLSDRRLAPYLPNLS